MSDRDLQARVAELLEELADLYGVAPAPTSSEANAVCQTVGGCAFEGRVTGPYVVGRCQRCGMGILDDLQI